MRAVVITKHGPPSVLKVQDRPDPPPPSAGQVRILVRAAGVNFADHLARVGLYPEAPKVPSVVGYEVAGTIEAVGDGVDRARVGQRVLAGTRFGGYAEIVNASADDTVALPESMSFEQGAAVPVNYATAWAARGEPIPCVITAMADEFGGEVPVGPFALIGGDEIGRGVVATLTGHRSPAVLMRSHGVFAIGSTGRDAVKAAVMCEDVARTVHLARAFGELAPLPAEAVDALFARYKNYYGQR